MDFKRPSLGKHDGGRQIRLFVEESSTVLNKKSDLHNSLRLHIQQMASVMQQLSRR